MSLGWSIASTYLYNKHNPTHRASPPALHWRRKCPKHSQELNHSCSAAVIKFSGFKDARRQLCLKVSWTLFNFLISSWVWNKRTTLGTHSWGKRKALWNVLPIISYSHCTWEADVAPWQAWPAFLGQLRCGQPTASFKLVEGKRCTKSHRGEGKESWRRLCRLCLCNVQPAFGLCLDLLALLEGANS